jgi:RND family efflux transporter MFP subunit
MRVLIRVGITLLSLTLSQVVRADGDFPFEVHTLQLSNVPVTQVLDGSVEAINRGTVSAQTSGRVIEINYDVDDYVEKGSIIVRLRDATQQANVDKAKAGLDEAKSRYIEARDEQSRVSKLHRKKLLSKSKLDAANAALSAMQAKVNAAKAQLIGAKEQLSNTNVKAPYSGIVTERFIEMGEIARPGSPLISGVSLEKLRVSVQVPQRLISAVRTIGKASVMFDGLEPIESTALVYFPYADAQTNSFRVRVNLDKRVEGVFPGMFAKVAFTFAETERLVVAESAIAYRSELTGLYVVNGAGNISLRQVRLGQHYNGLVEILAGASVGQKVALNPELAGIYLKNLSLNTSAGK